MLDYIKRMTREESDLTGKIKRAAEALKKADEIHLDKTQAVLLQEQVSFMGKYLDTLRTRIAYEKKLHGEN